MIAYKHITDKLRKRIWLLGLVNYNGSERLIINWIYNVEVLKTLKVLNRKIRQDYVTYQIKIRRDYVTYQIQRTIDNYWQTRTWSCSNLKRFYNTTP